MGHVTTLVSTVGFPIFVAVYLLIRLEPTLRDLQRTIALLTLVVARCNGVDVDECRELVGKELR